MGPFMVNLTLIFYGITFQSRCIDTNDEERDKGKTVEYGKAFFETEKKVVFTIF